MKSRAYPLLGILAVLPFASASADVLAEWTFNTGGTSAARLASSNVAAGAHVSGLSFNDSFDDVGPGSIPSSVHDGFGFGGNSGDEVIFLHRANYFDGSAVPDPRPTEGDYTSWGSGAEQGTGADLSMNGNAPIAFTVTGDAISTVTIDSITVDFTSGAGFIVEFQEAGAAVGSSVTLNGGNPLDDAVLNAPVVIAPGETKTFTININSGALDTGHNIDGFALNGTVVRDTAVPSLAEWTFNTGGTSAARLASSGVEPGAFVSGLSFNDSFTDVGPGAVPSDVHDGFGFGGNLTDQVLFLHRANYFDGSAVPDPRPTEDDYTSWGGAAEQGTGADLSSDGNAPIAFTVTADAISTITINSLTVDYTSQATSIWQIQEAGEVSVDSVTINGANPLGTTALNAPVVIGPGETKTFTISVNSGFLNSFSNIDGLALNGTVVRDTAVASVADWTFDNKASVATALESSGTASGLTVSSLAVNGSHDSFGVGAVPSGDNDGYGFGGNAGENVMFIHRANYFNGQGLGTTTWGNPGGSAGVDTTVANSPLSFTVTTDGDTTLTLVSLTVDRTPSAATLYHFQEGGAAAGASPGGSDDPATIALNAPVILNPGETKTFTLNLNSGSLDTEHFLNQISLNGTVESSADPFQTWALANGLTEGVNDGFEQNPESDAYSNGLEWILDGTTPLAFDGIGIGTTGNLLNVEVDGSNNLIFTFKRIDDSEGQATLKVQFSNDLFDSDNQEVTIGASGPDGVPPVGVTVDIVENGAAADDVTVTIPASYGDPDGKLFGRLQATQP
ncbi:MAG: hypothetical protein ACPG4K_07045 [Haloferula sp.]